MSNWNRLFEAVHSSLIDELNERFPKEKPELGLPSRQVKLQLPASAPEVVTAMAAVPLPGGKAHGMVFLACEPGLGPKHRPETLWQSLKPRADKLLRERGVAAVFSPGPGPEALVPEFRTIIWVPFRLSVGRVFLGMGVE